MTIILQDYSWQVKNSTLYITPSGNTRTQLEEKEMPMFQEKKQCDKTRLWSHHNDTSGCLAISSLSMKRTGPNVWMSHVQLKTMQLLFVLLWSPMLLSLAKDTSLLCTPPHPRAQWGFLLSKTWHTVRTLSKLSILSLVLRPTLAVLWGYNHYFSSLFLLQYQLASFAPPTTSWTQSGRGIQLTVYLPSICKSLGAIRGWLILSILTQTRVTWEDSSAENWLYHIGRCTSLWDIFPMKCRGKLSPV